MAVQISILGSGTVGRALARGFAAAGHAVTLGSRSPETVDSVLLSDIGADQAVEPVTAAREGDVVVLAVPGYVTVDLAADLATALAGKPVIDPTNEYPARNADEPLAVRVARAAPDAHVVKAFNTIGAEHFLDPEVDGERASMFICGDDDYAVDTSVDLAADLGFDPVVTGHLHQADRLENLARLWIDLAGQQGRDVAFRLLREDR